MGSGEESKVAVQDFQDIVSQFLVRHQSILDVLSKFQETNARVNRAVIKAVTNCGCLKVVAEKKPIPESACLSDLKDYLDTHLRGELCEECRDVIQAELGKALFYTTALCHTLGLNLETVMKKEHEKVATLRYFNFT
ncbi:MAG: DUF1573 domain-containing protein [Thermoanaerobacteraceae bacterium]|nr:DUF1573 domain-containing protein [Thermoanaerobacteraceae bacterium]